MRTHRAHSLDGGEGLDLNALKILHVDARATTDEQLASAGGEGTT
jgi:hypothetical protein